MATHKLPNYIRLYRKRLGLSQQEVGFLLGWHDGAQPSRYEHFSCAPRLRTALALALILRVSIHDLFPGEYEEIENAVCRKAALLEARLATKAPSERTRRKLVLLKSIVTGDDHNS